MIRDKQIHYRSSAEIKQFQEERLVEELQYLQANSKFYSILFEKNGIDISKIRHIEDLQSIPVTTKEDLQLHNADFLCVPKDEIIDYVTTSGTLGDPVTFALTSDDLDRLAYNEACSFSICGCTRQDVLQLMTTIDRRFMAGLAYFMGARELGCGVVRVGNGIPELQWDTIRRIKPTVCIVVPSFLLHLMDYTESNGINLHDCSLKKAICIGESLRTSEGALTTLGTRIRQRWPELELFSTYASTEMQTSFTECSCHNGGHVPADLIIVEVLDNENKPVPVGVPGEITITTIGVKGMPLLRFKTGDICIRYDEPCSCGRNTMRLSSVLGRKSQMIKFKGTTLYPPAMFDILDNIPEIENYIVEVYTNSIETDQVQIKVGSMNHSEEFVKQIKDIFRSKVRVAPDVVFEAPEIIARLQRPPAGRKVVKFIDLRN